MDTAWRCDGDGVGQTIDLMFARSSRVDSIGLTPGYSKIDPSDGTDRYQQNRRINAVRYEFDGGRTYEQNFDTGAAERGLQRIALPGLISGRVRITILGSVPGSNVGAKSAVDKVAISELSLGGDSESKGTSPQPQPQPQAQTQTTSCQPDLMTVDLAGHPLPSGLLQRATEICTALSSGAIDSIQPIYTGSKSGQPWSSVKKILQSSSYRQGLLKTLHMRPNNLNGYSYTGSHGYQIILGDSDYKIWSLSAPTSSTPLPSAQSDPYGCLAADRALVEGKIGYDTHPCAAHFQNQADPSEMAPDTPATRWGLCHDPNYKPGDPAIKRYCH